MQNKTLTGDPSLVDSGFDAPPENPLHLLKKWLSDADRLNVSEPRGLVLSTINELGKPSSRVVLLKTVDEEGVIFGSSEVSQKGRDLEKNPIAAGTLWWRETMQQINLFGNVTKLSSEISDEVFKDRTQEARAVAALSSQSAPMPDEKSLKWAVEKLAQQTEIIPRPVTWHAYYFVIESIEFWHGSRSRFHRRLRYDLKDGAWQHCKLQP